MKGIKLSFLYIINVTVGPKFQLKVIFSGLNHIYGFTVLLLR